jgi:hypothetical protein
VDFFFKLINEFLSGLLFFFAKALQALNPHLEHILLMNKLCCFVEEGFMSSLLGWVIRDLDSSVGNETICWTNMWTFEVMATLAPFN